MNWKFKLLLIAGIILLILSMIGLLMAILELSKDFDKLSNWCENNNIFQGCYTKTPECFYDCEKLGLEYFKLNVNRGFFSGVECYCKLNETSQRIW